jgi:hypothetical protein
MVQIVLSISKEHNKKLRDLAMKEFEGKKGALSAIVEHGIDLADSEEKRQKAHERLLYLARNAKNHGVGKFNRNEIYDERIQKILNRH